MEQQRWIDEITAYIRDNIDLTEIDHWNIQIKVKPDVCQPPTITPRLTPKRLCYPNTWIVVKVDMAAELWNQLAPGYRVFAKHVVRTVMASFGYHSTRTYYSPEMQAQKIDELCGTYSKRNFTKDKKGE